MLMYRLVLLLLFLLSVKGFDVDSSDTAIQVLGQSGKVKITRQNSTITMDFDSMYEKDSLDKIVGMQGSLQNKHGINSFATQNFVFGNKEDVVFQGISMVSFTFESPINTVGTLKVRVFISKSNGTIKNGNETYAIVEGDVKWNIEVPVWNFLAETEFLELNIIIKTLNDDEKVTQNGDKFTIGTMDLSTSNNVLIDNVLQPMPNGFPKLSIQGNKQIFTFKFPKFATSMIYDPIFSNATPSENTTTEGLSLLAIILIIAGSVLLVGAAVFAIFSMRSNNYIRLNT